MMTNKNTLLPALLALVSTCASAQMPIIQTKYTADPAPLVVGDTVYLYTTHDEDEDNADGFLMKDWLLYTSTDLVNWTDHGVVASLKSFAWHNRDNGAWAEQVVTRNGKYYMYCPIHGNGIGVLVSDSPYGPFTDPIGKPLVWNPENWDDIDPTVWIDDDGQAYMYWGNPKTYCIKLGEDMISTVGERMVMDRIEDYHEGPWFWKRGTDYYLAFASTCCPEGIGYAMSKSPTGPWVHRGHIMDHTPRTRGNHPGVMEFKGKWYVFGLNYDILRMETSEHHERRSVSMAEMQYNDDGTICQLPYFQDCDPIEPVSHLNPYQRIEAETMAWGYGLKTAEGTACIAIRDIDAGEYIKLRAVDFGDKGPVAFMALAAAEKKGGKIIVRIDAPDGPELGSLNIEVTGSAADFRPMHCTLNGGARGTHDLYLCFGTTEADTRDLFRLDWWMMFDEQPQMQAADNPGNDDRNWYNLNYADDDLEGHTLDIHLPNNDAPIHKVVILIYGSAWYANNLKGKAFQSLGQPLLDAGFAVISINHRSSGEAKFPAQIHDVKAAIRYVRAHASEYKLDCSFIGITGYSSGGHLSALAGATNGMKTFKLDGQKIDIEGHVGHNLKQSSRVDAVVDWFGPIDMSRMENCNTYKGGDSPEAALMGGVPSEHPTEAALLSPLTYLNKKSPRYVVIHGTGDSVVPYCQSEYMAEALKQNGLLEEFVTVPDGEHGPRTFNSDTFRRMVDFFLKVAG